MSFTGIVIEYLGLLFFIMMLALGPGVLIPRYGRWLKGARRGFYLKEGQITETDQPYKFLTSVIEIRRFLWWRWGTIHGPARYSWRISKIRGSLAFGNNIWLNWQRREDLGSALRLINSYSHPLALHDALDRVAELENELKNANNRRLEFRAAIKALINRMESDRQRYRSKPAADIRECLMDVDRWADQIGERQPERVIMETWPSRWPKTEVSKSFTDQIV